ncbi:hypothetical protein [Kutzneria sp. 744]|uniref:hypothetical protein n=1 Tax=Kutzneria sp. (strain 744) TaxID=345341 RepID=UPI0003EECDB9|nr:hypothetical protein [Kutzneria sp. 744]EWM18838.1 PE-PGRS family protein [Kutzneria sp. 744]
MIWWSVGLACGAACCQAVAAYWQHRAVRAGQSSGLLTGRALMRTLADRRWLLGLLMMAVGAAMHIAALATAPLVVIQPVGILALILIALPGRRSPRMPFLAIALTSVAVGLFVVLAASTSTQAAIPTSAVLSAVLIGAIAVAVLLASGLATTGRRRCALFGTGAGVLYGTVSAVIRAMLQHISSSGLDLITLVFAATIAIALLGAAWLINQAHANGPAAAVVATLTIVDPLVASGIGLFVYHESTNSSVGIMIAQAGCAIVAVVGALVLAGRLPELAAIDGRPTEEQSLQLM